jgi:hypothetical protein
MKAGEERHWSKDQEDEESKQQKREVRRFPHGQLPATSIFDVAIVFRLATRQLLTLERGERRAGMD